MHFNVFVETHIGIFEFLQNAQTLEGAMSVSDTSDFNHVKIYDIRIGDVAGVKPVLVGKKMKEETDFLWRFELTSDPEPFKLN